jgi:hypothetical protein
VQFCCTLLLYLHVTIPRAADKVLQSSAAAETHDSSLMMIVICNSSMILLLFVAGAAAGFVRPDALAS